MPYIDVYLADGEGFDFAAPCGFQGGCGRGTAFPREVRTVWQRVWVGRGRHLAETDSSFWLTTFWGVTGMGRDGLSDVRVYIPPRAGERGGHLRFITSVILSRADSAGVWIVRTRNSR